MMLQALRLALKFSSTTMPSPVLLFQALQVPVGYHAYLAFDTCLITEPISSIKNSGFALSKHTDFRDEALCLSD